MRALHALPLLMASQNNDPATPGDGSTDDTGDTTPVVDTRFDPLIAAVEADLEANGAHGASVAVWQDGAVVFARGFDGLTIGDQWYPVQTWEHGGNTLSFTSAFYILPDEDFALSILSSGYGDDFSQSVATAITSLVELPVGEPAAEFVVDTNRFDLHVGTYDDPYNVGQMIVTQVDDVVEVELPALLAAGIDYTPGLVALSGDIFYVQIEGDWYDLTFLGGDEESGSAWARNRAFVEGRVAEEPPAAQAAERHIPLVQRDPQAFRRQLTMSRAEGPTARLPSPMARD